jgi:hypothetical protein
MKGRVFTLTKIGTDYWRGEFNIQKYGIYKEFLQGMLDEVGMPYTETSNLLLFYGTEEDHLKLAELLDQVIETISKVLEDIM